MSVSALASELGLTFERPFAGGEFGAALVRDPNGRALVLKSMSADLAERFPQGAALAERARSVGVPAPEYLGTGTLGDRCWSVQEFLRSLARRPRARR